MLLANVRNPAIVALGVMALINMIWGAAFPITKPALDDMPPISFAFWRFTLALAILLPLSFRQVLALLYGPERNQLFIMGLLGFCITQITQVYSLVLSPATHIALMTTTTPLWVAIIAHITLKEPFTWRMRIGTMIALIGVGIVLNPHVGVQFAWSVWAGYAIYLVSAVGWASYNVMGRSLMQRITPLPATAAAALIGVACLLPFAVGEYVSGKQTHITTTSVFGVVYTAIFVTVVGYLTLFWALSKSSSRDVAAMMYFQPIAGTIVAWIWLDEQPTVRFFIGSALTFVGVWLVIRSPQSSNTVSQ
ncbi:MAG: DMT family transporter [Roseiflexaceae bacterium]